MVCRYGKRPYLSEDVADEAMRQFILQWGEDDPLTENLNVYQCPACSQWHLGHKGGKNKDQRLLEEIRKIQHKY